MQYLWYMATEGRDKPTVTPVRPIAPQGAKQPVHCSEESKVPRKAKSCGEGDRRIFRTKEKQMRSLGRTLAMTGKQQGKAKAKDKERTTTE